MFLRIRKRKSVFVDLKNIEGRLDFQNENIFRAAQ